MARVLWNKERSSGWTGCAAYRVCRVRRLLLTTGERRRVEIVSEIETDRTNRRLVAYPHADSVRNITEIALRRGTLLQARLDVLLLPAQQIVKHVVTIRKNVAGIVKNREAQVFLKERQCRRRHAKLQIIKKNRAAA